MIIAYLNINSIRNKFDCLEVIISNNIDILGIAETKLTIPFPPVNSYWMAFILPFVSIEIDTGGGILVNVRNGIPAKELKEYQLPDDIECGFAEINIKNKKWLLANIYRPPNRGERYIFQELGNALDHFSTKFESFILMGDFNTEENDENISNFMESYNLKNFVKTPTCFKSDRPRTIDLILANRVSNFQNTVSIETGLSNFHCMVATVVKGGFIKRGPKIINYRDYRKFDIDSFRKDLKERLLRQSQQALVSYDIFDAIVLSVLLNKHAPVKQKSVRANEGPFMTKHSGKPL